MCVIGYYNYTVILTYLSLASAVSGMLFTVNGHFRIALVCLAFSGLCDMFDGKVARAKKDRTEEEKRFGIQIDSLCDVVSFGIFPALWSYCMGMKSALGIGILILYTTGGVIRLGYFNVMEEKRQQKTKEARTSYSGLPITSIAIILPLAAMAGLLWKRQACLLLHITMLAVGILFVTRIRVPKPKNVTLAIFIAAVSLALLKIFRVF
ncbi:MAG: CDP-alcohol phosphatidyltransferase family protein [Clostridiales bacterium]|uniref:CDP-alcohol phosphatidyltransferase family protein n=1 Tax=Candidatus Pullilachnospira stercoravium TaxID=2840913 RepID=A0A9D1NV22_9FIRM|nr:CDP-alcohol phosphatidyltransferase family protein [Clostridiales bacterium]HIV13427.1 CDP-alcohol phosphatidyltransferase family protein [Candidatus Pullilachnospira stercoravium]